MQAGRCAISIGKRLAFSTEMLRIALQTELLRRRSAESRDRPCEACFLYMKWWTQLLAMDKPARLSPPQVKFEGYVSGPTGFIPPGFALSLWYCSAVLRHRAPVIWLVLAPHPLQVQSTQEPVEVLVHFPDARICMGERETHSYMGRWATALQP